MDVITGEALQSLTSALTALVPAAVRPALLVVPVRASPIGLGGFIDVNDEPQGDIVGRRLEALALVTVSGNDTAALQTVAEVCAALVGADRAALRSLGILRINLGSPGSVSERAGNAARELSFRVLYEYMKRPVDSEGIIQQIPIQVALD